MPSIWKRLSHQPKIEDYKFPDADELNELELLDVPQFDLEEQPEEEKEEPETDADSDSALSYADIQAAAVMEEARKQAEDIVKQAQEEAARLTQEAHEQGYQQGYEVGLAKGTRQGTEQAKQEVLQQERERIDTLSDQVEEFLKKANSTLNEQMDANAIELRDLAIAVAEKVIGVSLDSSADVIERMIRMAIEKRKRCEWVQIYVSNRSARRLVELSPLLATSFAALSDHVRIVPMKDDEPGACIIEMPGEIIDASVSTQIENIRTALSETPLDYEGTLH